MAAAFEGSLGRSPPRYGTPPVRPLSPQQHGILKGAPGNGKYGTLEAGPAEGGNEEASPKPVEDPEIVKRYLVRPSHEELHPGFASPEGSGRASRDHGRAGKNGAPATEAPDLDEFSSLQLQGGDVTREIYRWAEDAETQSISAGRGKRSRSFHAARPEPEDETLNVHNIRAPGGLRRDYLRRSAVSPSPARPPRLAPVGDLEENANRQPQLFTNNFIEFLTLYGHFAGEELEDDDTEDYEADDYFPAGQEGEEEAGESSALLTPRTPGGKRRLKRSKTAAKDGTQLGALLLLLKSFVGTGVLFLPRAFLNGGMLFSSLVLLGVAGLSYYCFLLLVNTRLKIDGSYGDIGGVLFGKSMRNLILTSIVLSQIGFVAAYIVFTSENLQAFIMAVSHCRTWIDIKWMVLMQLIIFLPLSLIRDINKLGFTALVADGFILLGLLYLYYFDIATLVANGVADIVPFNANNWTLFIGTAIFTFEGIGLILPIQEGMKNPAEFPPVLGVVMIIITIIFTSMGALSYAAFGSTTHTVVLLDLPQNNRFVNGVQFLYSLAILLSTPLQLFPAIRILENAMFDRSGKFNPYIKWKKNVFRFLLVMVCAAIAWGGAGDLDKFVALVGSFACIPLVYVYPVRPPRPLATVFNSQADASAQPLLHLRSCAHARWQRVSDILLCIFGVVAMTYTTVQTIINWAGSSSGPKQPEICSL